jgi:hypothetical protein
LSFGVEQFGGLGDVGVGLTGPTRRRFRAQVKLNRVALQTSILAKRFVIESEDTTSQKWDAELKSFTRTHAEATVTLEEDLLLTIQRRIGRIHEYAKSVNRAYSQHLQL